MRAGTDNHTMNTDPKGTDMDTTTFQPGATYAVRSNCDWDTVFRYTVVSRTARFITIDTGWETKRVGVKVSDGVEYALPEGSYSMAPVIRASHPQA